MSELPEAPLIAIHSTIVCVRRGPTIPLLLLILSSAQPLFAVKRRSLPQPQHDSIEWMEVLSPVIVHASIEFDYGTHRFHLQVIAPIRGPMAGASRIRPMLYPWMSLDRLSPLHGRQAIAFLLPRTEFESFYWLDEIIILDTPEGPRDLNGRRPCSIDGQPVKSPEQVLSQVRAAVAWERPGSATPVNWDFWSSHADLIVPQDARLEVAAQKWLVKGNLNQRTEAARCIEPFKSEQNIALLKRLLVDPETHPSDYHKMITRYFYSARGQAYLTLRRWNIDVAEPTTVAPHWVWQWARVYPGKFSTALIMLVLPPIAWVALRNRRKRGRRFVEKWSWRRLILAALCLASAMLAAGIADGWRIASQSPFHIQIDRERSSLFVHFQFHRIQVTRDFYADPQISDFRWDDGAHAGSFVAPERIRRIFGVWFTDNNALIRGNALRQTFVNLPTIYPLGVSLLLPLLWLKRQFRFARRRHRAAQGHCIACGYDLRHSPARCPECGAVPDQRR